MKIRLFVIFLMFAWSAAGQTKTPKYSNEFLLIGVGGRALAMANAQVAVAGDVTAAYWNPAGLTQVNRTYELSLMHAAWFAGVANYDYAGFATPIDSNTFMGASVIRFGIDNIPDTRFLYDASGAINYDRIRFFSAADYAFLFTVAKKLGPLSLGGNLKVIHRTVGEFANAWGYGLDAALNYRLGTWAFGAVLRDATGTFNAWSHNSQLVVDVYTQTGNRIPENSLEITLPRLSPGISKTIRVGSSWKAVLAADADITFDGRRNTLLSAKVLSVDPKAGAEIGYRELVFVRGGIGQYQQVKDFDGSKSWTSQPSFGVGIQLRSLAVDYALTDIGNSAEAPYSHVFSLKYGWNARGGE